MTADSYCLIANENMFAFLNALFCKMDCSEWHLHIIDGSFPVFSNSIVPLPAENYGGISADSAKQRIACHYADLTYFHKVCTQAKGKLIKINCQFCEEGGGSEKHLRMCGSQDCILPASALLYWRCRKALFGLTCDSSECCMLGKTSSVFTFVSSSMLFSKDELSLLVNLRNNNGSYFIQATRF